MTIRPLVDIAEINKERMFQRAKRRLEHACSDQDTSAEKLLRAIDEFREVRGTRGEELLTSAERLLVFLQVSEGKLAKSDNSRAFHISKKSRVDDLYAVYWFMFINTIHCHGFRKLCAPQSNVGVCIHTDLIVLIISMYTCNLSPVSTSDDVGTVIVTCSVRHD